MARTAALIVVISATLAAGPVAAQFGNPFNDSPPRPPADVPNGFPAQPPPVQYPSQQQYPAQQQYSPPQQYPAQQYPAQQYPAQRQAAPTPAPVARGPSSIQAQPLAPPPGASSVPANANRGSAPA
ncbi:MAG: hypothetical protein WA230_11000, partial [Xanthobacteraceae bacterium]